MDLIFIHGPAAAGKLTTARALERIVGYPVFHNHLVVDALTTVFPFGTEPFVRLREQWWLQVFADAARCQRSLIFTFAPEPTVAAGFPDRVTETVQQHGAEVRYVELRVSDAEQEHRIGDESRRAFHKLTDVSTLRQLRSQAQPTDRPPADLVIDTDKSTADQSAAAIANAFDLARVAPTVRYLS